MDSTHLIIHFNRMINWHIQDKNYEAAAKYMLALHKLERKAKVPIGEYRLRQI